MKGISGDTAQTLTQYLSFDKLVSVRVRRAQVWQKATQPGYIHLRVKTQPFTIREPGSSPFKHGNGVAFLACKM
eukprot:10365359-Karenia_brevis.AAC.1